jgi:endonuclease/exonuclease/phosphatase family metal-dependent hydrolase
MVTMLFALLLNSFAQAAQAEVTAARPAGADARMSVMTFNIRLGTANDGSNHWTHRRGMVFDVLRKHRPDLVGMQEVIKFQLDEVLEAVPEYAAFGVGREDGKSAGEYSPILYRKSRFRVLEEGTFWLSETPEVPGSKSWDTACTRVCTWGRFADRTNGRTFYLFNTHLDHVSQAARENGVALILKRMKDRKHGDPVFFTGDFNAGEDNPVVRNVIDATQKGSSDRDSPTLRDSFRVVHPDEKVVGTFNRWNGKTDGAKIDYVFVPDSVEVKSAKILHDNVDGRYPSDHYPVTATVEWLVRE